MGGKPSHSMQSNRPESGGADYKDAKESSGILDRAKEEFAAADKAKHEQSPDHSHDAHSDGTAADAPQPHG